MDDRRIIEYYYKGVNRSIRNGQWADINDKYIRLKYPGGYKLVILSDVEKGVGGLVQFDDNSQTIRIGNDHVLKFTSPPVYQTRKQKIQRYVGTSSSPCADVPFTNAFVRKTFSTVGSFTWEAPCNVSQVSYLVVGGGGGGGGGYDVGPGGGGGAGLVLSGTTSVSTLDTYTIIVGSGGSGGSANRNASPIQYDGNDGGSSPFSTILASGGKGGKHGRSANPGSSVGNGGTQANSTTPPGGGSGGPGGGGGGGGGGNSSGGGGARGGTGGSGGSGVSNSISGSSVTYGVGGNGGTINLRQTGSNGTNGRGNGGGGASPASFDSRNGGNGGSGIVIITYYE
jgi:hypothetical protein